MKGITLIEIMIIVAIAAILIATLMPVISGYIESDTSQEFIYEGK